jgi:hypothetical protein
MTSDYYVYDERAFTLGRHNNRFLVERKNLLLEEGTKANDDCLKRLRHVVLINEVGMWYQNCVPIY